MYPHSKCLLSTYHGFYGLPRLENKKKTEKKEREIHPTFTLKKLLGSWGREASSSSAQSSTHNSMPGEGIGGNLSLTRLKAEKRCLVKVNS